MMRAASDILSADNLCLIAITNVRRSFLLRGYQLFKVQERSSLNLLPNSGWGVGGEEARRSAAPEEERRGSAAGALAAPPRHLLQANGCYNLINVMKLDIIP